MNTSNSAILDNAWDEYRGWARRARTLQHSNRVWNTAALGCAVLAAVLGSAASQAPAGKIWGQVVSLLAALAAAITPVLGKDILAVGREAGWIQARATAEALKSECFRYAARINTYAGPNSQDIFMTKCKGIEDHAFSAGLTPLPEPQNFAQDRRKPSIPLMAEWYREHRINDQVKFYRKGQRRNESLVSRLRIAGLTAAVVAAALGVLGSFSRQNFLAPWIGAATTLGTMLVAYGLLDRRQYLAASYGAMASALGRIGNRYRMDDADLQALVKETEDLLEGEHVAWIERMKQTAAAPIALPNRETGT